MSTNEPGKTSDTKVSISWDELTSPKVEERLNELSTVRTTRSHYETSKVAAPVVETTWLAKLCLNAWFYMPAVGVIAGVLGWICATLLGLAPNQESRAKDMLASWNAIDRAVLLSSGDSIDPQAVPAGEHVGDAAAGARLRQDLATFERQRIVEALDKCAGNQTKAAQLLGISRRTLVSRLGEYNLPRPRGGGAR